MKNLFFGIMSVVYLVSGIVQWFAAVDGFSFYFGLQHKLLAWILAAVLTYIPFVGSAAGIYGAHHAWGWDWWSAIVLFGWWYGLWLLYIAGSAIIDRR